MSTYLRVPLAAAPASVRRAREVVRAWLVDVGRSNTEYVAAQIVTELTTNSVVHAHGPVVLHLWCRRDGVRIGVSDGSTDPPALPPEDPSASSGRGLRLVDRLATRWECEAHERGKITWAEITQDAALGAVPDAAPDLHGTGRPARWHLGWRGEEARRRSSVER
jgi:anti-sigma regulatory factor (Ser/Thr protein kinase)